MDPTQFTARSPGNLVSTAEGVLAFVPHRLPPAIELDMATVRLLGRAENALGQLNGTTGRLVNPYLVGSPLLHREAILSSRIEGTITTPEELVLFEVSRTPVSGASRIEDTREVQNYISAMRHGLTRLQELPVCLRLIREVHAVLMAGVRGDRERPGEFRTLQNYIGFRPSDPIQSARFVPPPVDEMHRALEDFEAYLQATYEEELPLLVRLALVHYQFEAIHPFRDGNGRLGRLLIPLLLCSHQRLVEPLLYLSSYFERHRETYYDLLLSVSLEGNWLSWVRFFLQGVLECSAEATAQAEGLLDLRQRYHERFQSARSSALLLKLVDQLFKRPSTTIGEAARVLGISYGAASNNIRKLQQEGFVEEWTGRKRDQIFVAPEILEFMNAPHAAREAHGSTA